MRFISDTGYFKHPSATGNMARGTRQGVSKRPKALFIKVNQWIFPDSAAFKGNILTCDVSEINSAMEQYAQWMLLLLHSYRSMQDLSPDMCDSKFPFVLKLRELSIQWVTRLEYNNVGPVAHLKAMDTAWKTQQHILDRCRCPMHTCPTNQIQR